MSTLSFIPSCNSQLVIPFFNFGLKLTLTDWLWMKRIMKNYYLLWHDCNILFFFALCILYNIFYCSASVRVDCKRTSQWTTEKKWNLTESSVHRVNLSPKWMCEMQQKNKSVKWILSPYDIANSPDYSKGCLNLQTQI